MHLTDLASLDEWKQLEQQIVDRSGLNASVFGTDGVRITDFQKWSNKLCPKVKANEKGQSYICAVAHQNIATQAEKQRGPVIEECDGGLLKLVVPIFMNDTFLGVVGGCGLLLGDGEVDTWMINKTTGIDEGELEELADGIEAMTTPKAEEVITFIREQIDRIVQRYADQEKT